MAPGNTKTFSTTSTFTGVRTVLIEIMNNLDGSMAEEKFFTTELALAEMLNNVVEHAYQETDGNHILIDVSCSDGCAFFKIVDNGQPNPSLEDLNAQEIEPLCLAEGGYGNNLIKTLASKIEYRRANDQNITKIWL